RQSHDRLFHRSDAFHDLGALAHELPQLLVRGPYDLLYMGFAHATKSLSSIVAAPTIFHRASSGVFDSGQYLRLPGGSSLEGVTHINSHSFPKNESVTGHRSLRESPGALHAYQIDVAGGRKVCL